MAEEAKKLIQFKNIVKTFDDGTVVLKGISLDVEEGQIVSIIGSNGAGKSSMMNTISGIGHDWGQPVWNWAADNNSATATFTCSVCPPPAK